MPYHRETIKLSIKLDNKVHLLQLSDRANENNKSSHDGHSNKYASETNPHIEILSQGCQ